MRPKVRIFVFLATLVVAVPVIVVVQGWEEHASGERVAVRVGALEAFANQDYDVAAPGLAAMADEGSAVAQAKLAFLYENGLVVEQDFEAAKRWYRAASEQGDKDAKLALARLLEDKEGDRSLASSLYMELATAGSAEAAIRLAALHFDGTGIPQDYVAAARWFSHAAEVGHPEAQLQLGLLYRDGLGVPQDVVFAHMWLNLAAARFPAADHLRRAEAVAARDDLVARMRETELRESLQLAREWQSANS